MYEPTVRAFEVENQLSHERFTITFESPEPYFSLYLPAGAYRLNRVQISEGPFLSMSQLDASFVVGSEPVTYVGTWRFGVDSPRYGRMVQLSLVMSEDEGSEAIRFLHERYPELVDPRMAFELPQPSQAEARLYEVMPYPRYPRYFRRHWW